MQHEITIDEGKDDDGNYLPNRDPRNHIAVCSCGWCVASTSLEAEKRAEYHVQQNNPLSWRDPKRVNQTDKEYPPYRSMF
jgi:hypothetical protein